MLASLGMGSITWGLSQVGSRGSFTTATSYVPIIAGVLLLGVFCRHGLRRRSATLLDLRLFTRRRFAAAVSALVLVGMALFGVLLLLPLYFQTVRGHGPLGAGLLLVPQGLGVAVALPFAGRLTDRLGPRRVVLPGIALMLLGTLAVTQVAHYAGYPLLISALVVRGVGMGLVMTPVTAAAFIAQPAAPAPQISVVTTAARQAGGSIGTALLAVILTTSHRSTPAPATAFGHAFWAAVALTALALAPAALLPGASRTASAQPQERIT